MEPIIHTPDWGLLSPHQINTPKNSSKFRNKNILKTVFVIQHVDLCSFSEIGTSKDQEEKANTSSPPVQDYFSFFNSHQWKED